MSGKAAPAGNTLCIAKGDNEAWRKSGRKDSQRSIGEEYNASVTVILWNEVTKNPIIFYAYYERSFACVQDDK